jgi:hypothetical protein
MNRVTIVFALAAAVFPGRSLDHVNGFRIIHTGSLPVRLLAAAILSITGGQSAMAQSVLRA